DYRPRRQERAPHYRETGAFYVMRTAGFRERQVRFFGRIGLQPSAPEWALEIDEPRDPWLARQLVGQPDAAALEPETTGGAAVASALDVGALGPDLDGPPTRHAPR